MRNADHALRVSFVDSAGTEHAFEVEAETPITMRLASPSRSSTMPPPNVLRVAPWPVLPNRSDNPHRRIRRVRQVDE